MWLIMQLPIIKFMFRPEQAVVHLPANVRCWKSPENPDSYARMQMGNRLCLRGLITPFEWRCETAVRNIK